jgi:hypothetical protein
VRGGWRGRRCEGGEVGGWGDREGLGWGSGWRLGDRGAGRTGGPGGGVEGRRWGVRGWLVAAGRGARSDGPGGPGRSWLRSAGRGPSSRRGRAYGNGRWLRGRTDPVRTGSPERRRDCRQAVYGKAGLRVSGRELRTGGPLRVGRREVGLRDRVQALPGRRGRGSRAGRGWAEHRRLNTRIHDGAACPREGSGTTEALGQRGNGLEQRRLRIGARIPRNRRRRRAIAVAAGAAGAAGPPRRADGPEQRRLAIHIRPGTSRPRRRTGRRLPGSTRGGGTRNSRRLGVGLAARTGPGTPGPTERAPSPAEGTPNPPARPPGHRHPHRHAPAHPPEAPPLSPPPKRTGRPRSRPRPWAPCPPRCRRTAGPTSRPRDRSAFPPAGSCP